MSDGRTRVVVTLGMARAPSDDLAAILAAPMATELGIVLRRSAAPGLSAFAALVLLQSTEPSPMSIDDPPPTQESA